MSDEKDNTFWCSFCGKSHHEVLDMIQAKHARICTECVNLCADIVRESAIKRHVRLYLAEIRPSALADMISPNGKKEEK